MSAMVAVWRNLRARLAEQGTGPGQGHGYAALVITGLLGIGVGLAQLVALGSMPTLLPLWLLVGVAYIGLALSRHVAALAVLVVAFIEFWGVVPEAAEAGPLKVIDIVCVIAFLPVVLGLIRTGFPFHEPAARRLRIGASLILLLFLGEVVLTTLSSGQDIWHSVKAGKPYLYYFGFLLVPAYAATAAKVRSLIAWMTAIAAILAVAYLVVSFAGETGLLPALVAGETNFIGVGTFTRVRSMGAPLIVAMLLYQFYKFADGRSSGLEKIALCLLSVGAMVHFYRSIWVGILAGVILQAGVEGRKGTRNLAKFVVVVAVVLLVIGFIHPEYVVMIGSRAVSTLSEVQEGRGSYGVRQDEIERWLPILRENWLLGIGFLHHDSSYGQQMEALYALEGTGNYDVGWVDLLGRLGVVGISVLAVALGCFSRPGWSVDGYRGGAEAAILNRTVTAFLVMGVISMPGYAVLSWSGGIFPLALLVGMIGVLEQAPARESLPSRRLARRDPAGTSLRGLEVGTGG